MLAGLYHPASGTEVNLKYPRFDFFTQRGLSAVATEVDMEAPSAFILALFRLPWVNRIMTWLRSSSPPANDPQQAFYNKVGDNKITIRKVYYKTPHAMWRFYGYYGGINTGVTFSTYGMYSDSTFHPVWQISPGYGL